VAAADAMARDTYSVLVQAKGILGENGQAVPYSTIAGDINKFNSATSDAAKHQVLVDILHIVNNH
jgi:hypothetical protein